MSFAIGHSFLSTMLARRIRCSTGSSAESTELADLSGLMRARNRRTLPGCRFGPGRVGDKPGAAPQGVAAHNHGCLVTQADSNKQL
jgi:hypothetical protein